MARKAKSGASKMGASSGGPVVPGTSPKPPQMPKDCQGGSKSLTPGKKTKGKKGC